MCAGQCICTEWNFPGVHFQRGECYLSNQPECSSGKVMSINMQKNGQKLSFVGPTFYLQCNSFYYRRSSIKTPQGAYLFSTHLRGGLIEAGGLF